MDPNKLSSLFRTLQGAKIKEIFRDGEEVRMTLFHPSLAAKTNPDFTQFFCTLSACKDLYFQPFANSSTLLRQFPEILSLDLSIQGAVPAPGGKARIICRMANSNTEGSLYARTEEIFVYNEAFDRL